MTDTNLSSATEVARSILVVRGLPLMLDADLAGLYGVSTKALNQAVKRNLSRFPADFAFRLDAKEAATLRSLRSPGSTQRHRDPSSAPLVFTEHGATVPAMVLRSPRAIDMSCMWVARSVE